MNAKKERDLFAAGLERVLQNENKIVREYRTLAELVESIPAGLCLDWLITKKQVHHILLCIIIRALKEPPQVANGNGTNGVGIERDKVLLWIEQLRSKEQALVTDCGFLKSQGCWEDSDLVEALLDALVMDSKKRQRFLLTVEKTVENMKTSRLQ